MTLTPTSVFDLKALRSAQKAWAHSSLSTRLRVVQRLRNGIASDVPRLLDLFPGNLLRSRADTIVSEILPLAEACRFLETEAHRILAPQYVSNKARPFWLRKISIQIVTEPLGLVLVVGPSNYPLFLAATPALQALVAGNAVLLKPGRAASPVLSRFVEIAIEAGIPRDLIAVLSEDTQSVRDAVDSSVDKIVLTGSVETGRTILRQAAEHITPAILELSGDDPVFIQASAHLERAAKAISFALKLNDGDTCLAPKHIYVDRAAANEFLILLKSCLLQHGVVGMPVDVIPVSNDDEALNLAADNPHALGATIFGSEADAVSLAKRVRAGVVVINDAVVPTADPRVPFGGRGLSGFGSTRGAQGLLEMTTPKAILLQRAKRLRHLEPLPNCAEELFSAYVAAVHKSSWRERISAWRGFARLAKSTGSKLNEHNV